MRRILPELLIGRDVSELGLILASYPVKRRSHRARDGDTCDGEMRAPQICHFRFVEQKRRGKSKIYFDVFGLFS